MGIIGLFIGLVVAVILIGCLARAGKGFAHEMRTGEELPERYLSADEVQARDDADQKVLEYWARRHKTSAAYADLGGNTWYDGFTEV